LVSWRMGLRSCSTPAPLLARTCHRAHKRASNSQASTPAAPRYMCTLQAVHPEGDSLTSPPQRRPVEPLSFSSEQLLYKSQVEIQDIVVSALFHCRVGAGLAAVGFAALWASIAVSQSLPLPALAVLLCGAGGNSYALAVVAQRLIKKLAERHVESVTVLPCLTPAAEEPWAAGTGAQALLLHAASMEERLAVTPELQLQVHTASAVRWLVLADLVDLPEESADGKDFTTKLNVEQAPFSTLCGRLQLLYIDQQNGTCSDQALLDALLASSKVAVSERVEPRDDVVEDLRIPPGAPVPGPMLADVTRADAEQLAKSASKVPPGIAIDTIGRRALFGGASVLAAGGLFAIGESARDADGAVRWINLKRLAG